MLTDAFVTDLWILALCATVNGTQASPGGLSLLMAFVLEAIQQEHHS